MTNKTKSVDYYGSENTPFSFFRIPRQLMTGKRFRQLSAESKLLYGLLLDRVSLSAKNGWYDEAGHVYIYYTLREIQENFNCGHDKATKLLVELESRFGLIMRVKQGMGRPAKIYVKCFTVHDPSFESAEMSDTNFGSLDIRKTEVQTS